MEFKVMNRQFLIFQNSNLHFANVRFFQMSGKAICVNLQLKQLHG